MVGLIDRDVPIIVIKNEWKTEAVRRANIVRGNTAKLNEYTHRKKGEGIELGCLAEIIFEEQLNKFKILKSEWENTNTTILDYTVKEIKIEVKSKDRTVPPRLNYACTVSDYNINHQNVDYYYFISFERGKDEEAGDNGIKWPHSAHLVGASSSNFFKRHSLYLKKGERDGDNMLIKFDCHNIYIYHTIPNYQFMIKILGGVDGDGIYSGNS